MLGPRPRLSPRIRQFMQITVQRQERATSIQPLIQLTSMKASNLKIVDPDTKLISHFLPVNHPGAVILCLIIPETEFAFKDIEPSRTFLV